MKQKTILILRFPLNNVCTGQLTRRYFNNLNDLTKLLLAVAIAGSAMLGLSGCAVQVRGRQRPLLSVRDIRGELEISAERQTDESKSSSASQENVSTILEEKIRLQAKGDVFHSRLMSYLASLGLGLTQQQFRTKERSDSGTGTLSDYRLDMHFLPLKPYPFSVSLSKTEDVVPRRFRSPLRVESTGTGFATHLRVPEWPMSFSWFSTETEQDSDMSQSDDLFKRESDRWSFNLRHNFSERSRMTVRSDWDSLSEKARVATRDLETTRHRVDHDFYFGSERQHRLDSALSLVEKVGNFESETFNWDENLVLQHSRDFMTFYNSTFTKNTFGSAESESFGGAAGLNHRLYSNFVTNLSLFATKTEYDPDSETTWQGGKLGFNYTRNNPWGKLFSSYSIDVTKQENSGAAGTGLVLGESHVFRDPFAVTLENRDIITSTIIVSNSTGSETYSLGDDYTIRMVDDRVELDVTTLGVDLPNVVDGQVLLVDYQYHLPEATEVESRDQYFRIGQDFKNRVSVFYSHQRFDEEITSNLDIDVTEDNWKTDVLGISYRGPRVSLRAERSETQSTTNTSESTLLSGSCVWPLMRRTTFSGGASQSWVEASGDNDRESSMFELEGEIESWLTKHLKVSTEANWRNEDNSDTGRTRGLRMGVALGYDYRSISVTAGWDTYQLERVNTETTNSNVYIKVIRRF